jgi:nucleotide-binding universal stress UspA family protein
MYKQILVPLDGSALAERALPVASRVAHASGGALLVLRVIPSAELLAPPAASLAIPTAAEHERASAYLRTIAQRPDLAGLPTESVIREGDPAATILEEAASRHTELIILGSHGRTGLLRWVLGSVAERVARHAALPVLVVRADGPIPAGPHPDAERPLCILVGLDGSARAESALGPAIALVTALATPAQGAVHLLRVVHPYLVEEQAQQHPHRACTDLPAVEQAKAYLSGVAAQLHQVQQAPVRVTWSVNISGDVAQALAEGATSGEDAEGAGVFGRCDLIALATHGRTGLQRWAVGSVAERVLQSSRLPLLIVRPASQ